MTLTDSILDVCSALRETLRRGVTSTFEWRRDRLRELRRLVIAGETVLEDALARDLGKSELESFLTDLAPVTQEVDFALRHLRAWMRPTRAPVPFTQRPARARVIRQPLGVVGVVAAWNYPVNLTLAPAVGALAGGNTVVIKPSELAPATSAALVALASEHLDPGAVAVVAGGADAVAAIIDAGVDHLLYTGGAGAARAVVALAAQRLTPVTLELGGKNPAIVLADADLRVAARRIAWGRFLNAGQTCVSPDYVLVEREAEARFVEFLLAATREFFGADPKASTEFSRVVDQHHFARITALLDGHGGEVLCGGECDPTTRYVAPTVVRGADPDSALGSDEVFGPILAVDAVSGLDEALARVAAHPDPLALYVFTSSRERADDVIHRTRSGAIGINSTVLHAAIPGLPFGGVGASGTGAYHGRAGFERFSHQRAVFEKSTRLDLPVLYPPYRSWKEAAARRALRFGPKSR